MKRLYPFLLFSVLLMAALAGHAQPALRLALLRGQVNRGQGPARFQPVNIARITTDLGVIDSSLTVLFHTRVLADSLGRFDVQVPISPDNYVRNLYVVSVANCDSQLLRNVVEVPPAGTTLQPILLCVPNTVCSLDPGFAPDIKGNTVFPNVFHPTPGSKHRWQWGDGSIDTSASPYHTYDSSGTYSIVHTEVFGPNCLRFYSITITIGGIVPPDAYVFGKLFLEGNVCVSRGVLVRFFPVDTSNHQRLIFPDSICGYRGAVQPGRYLIRAIPNSPELIRAGYLPTFYGGVSRWDTAAIVNISQSRFDLDITLRKSDTAKAHHGRCKIHVRLYGHGTLVNSTVPKASARILNAEDVPVYLLDNTASVVDFGTLAPGATEISFTNLDAGNYVLVPDAPFVAASQHPLMLASASAESWVDYTITSGGIVAGITAVTSNLAAETLIAYPNPAAEQITVRVSNGSGSAQVRLLAIDGRAVQTQDVSLSESFTVPIQSLPAGIYQLCIMQQGRSLGALRVQVVN